MYNIVHVCIIFYSHNQVFDKFVYNAVPVSHYKAVLFISMILSCTKKTILVPLTCNLYVYKFYY